MATFQKRGNWWSFRIDVGRDPETDKRRQLRVSFTKEFPAGFKTKKDAQTAAATMQHELDHGTHVREKDMLFPTLVDEWMKVYAKQVKVSTVRVRKHESGHLSIFFERIKAKDVTKIMYQAALNELETKGLSPQTRDGIHGTGRMIFKYAMKHDIIKIDPTLYAVVNKPQTTVEQLESGPVIPKYLEKNELALFLETARLQGLEDDFEIFCLLAYSGIRCGELCASKWADFDFVDHTMNINKTYYNPTNNILEYELLTPKTKNSIRKIELESEILELLEPLRARQNEFKMLHRKTYHDKGFVFSSDKHPGYPIYIKLIEYRMKRLLKIAGLNPTLTPHSLRHTHTSLLAEAEVGLDAIMERLGHKDDETTKNVYLHVTKTMKKEASKKFGNLMKTSNFRAMRPK